LGSSPTTGDDPADEIVWTARRPADGLGSPAKLAEGGLRRHVGVDAAGNVVAVWMRDDIQTVRTAPSRRAGSWRSAVGLPAPGQDATLPGLAVKASRAYVVLWLGYDGTHWCVQATSRPSGGTRSAPLNLTADDEHCPEPAGRLRRGGQRPRGLAAERWPQLADGGGPAPTGEPGGYHYWLSVLASARACQPFEVNERLARDRPSTMSSTIAVLLRA
jgi:hypothetical protein